MECNGIYWNVFIWIWVAAGRWDYWKLGVSRKIFGLKLGVSRKIFGLKVWRLAENIRFESLALGRKYSV
jgi:hypothetical protein